MQMALGSLNGKHVLCFFKPVHLGRTVWKLLRFANTVSFTGDLRARILLQPFLRPLTEICKNYSDSSACKALD